MLTACPVGRENQGGFWTNQSIPGPGRRAEEMQDGSRALSMHATRID